MKVKQSCSIEEMSLEASEAMRNQKKGMKGYLKAYQMAYLMAYQMAYQMAYLRAYSMMREGIGLKRIGRKGSDQ